MININQINPDDFLGGKVNLVIDEKNITQILSKITSLSLTYTDKKQQNIALRITGEIPTTQTSSRPTTTIGLNLNKNSTIKNGIVKLLQANEVYINIEMNENGKRKFKLKQIE